MKFGKTFQRLQVVEWSRHYVNYKMLKQRIKGIRGQQRQHQDTQNAVAEFIYTLDRELEKISAFYLYKKAEIERRLTIYSERYRRPVAASQAPGAPTDDGYELVTDADAGAELLHALQNLREEAGQVERFVQLNHEAFVKILKKFDKNVRQRIMETYLASKVEVSPFASPDALREIMATLDALMASLQPDDAHGRVTPAPMQHFGAGLSLGGSLAGAPNGVAGLAHERGASAPPLRKITLSDEDAATLRQCLHDDDADRAVALLRSLIAQRSAFMQRKLQQMLFLQAAHQVCPRTLTALVHFPVPLAEQEHDLHQRNLLHRLIIVGGFVNGELRRTASFNHDQLLSNEIKQNRSAPGDTPPTTPTADDGSTETCVELVLSELASSGRHDELRTLLLARDVLGRRPLHYSVLRNCPKTTAVLLRHLKNLHGVDVSNACHGDEWWDNEGYSPMLYCVLKGFDTVLRLLVDETRGLHQADSFAALPDVRPPNVTSPTTLAASAGAVAGGEAFAGVAGGGTGMFRIPHPQTLLSIACHFGHAGVAQILLESGADPMLANRDGETPLHFACKHGHAGAVSLVLAALRDREGVDAQERHSRCTPLHLAAMEGFVDCVRPLLDAGANVELRDAVGCTAFEYAVLRSHRPVVELLQPRISPYPLRPAARATPGGALSPEGLSTAPVSTAPVATAVDTTAPGTLPQSATVPERAYGHKFLQEETVILVYPGTMDTRKPVAPVTLRPNLLSTMSARARSYSLIVSAAGAHGERCIYDLPIKEHVAEPIPFYTTRLDEVMILFDIQPTFGSRKDIIGRATALLSTAKTSLYQERTSLGGSVTVPIIASSSLDVLGTVTFEFTVVTPFSHPNMRLDARRMYWKSMTTKVIGHRGSGANRAVKGSSNLQLGENTVLSFVTAASLGAEYVEFDVQLTKDAVPVLYHDWTLTESGYDIPVNAMTLDQFLALHPKHAPANIFALTSAAVSRDRARPGGAPPGGNGEAGGDGGARGEGTPGPEKGMPVGRKKPSRSISMGHFQWQREIGAADGGAAAPDAAAAGADAAVPLGGKGNSFGTIQAPFATLAATFKEVPASIGFNIEVKYPCIEEAEAHDLRPAELNAYVDCILRCVYDNAGARQIIFSSFNPEVCLMLNSKQCNYPVFFLTEAGLLSFADVRCNSLQAAIRFAKSVNLLGVVTESTPLTLAPALIPLVRETGLLLFSYGQRNNDVTSSQIQRNYGVDAVIVDSVAKVHRGLREGVP